MEFNSAASLASAATLTASANQAGVNVTAYTGKALLVLNPGMPVGADNTLDVKIQHSNDNGATDPWADTGTAFAQTTHTTYPLQSLTVDIDTFKSYIRVVDTVAGTTPSVSRSVELIAKNPQH